MTADVRAEVEAARAASVLICGRTNLEDRAEAITRVLRETQGFQTDGGCGRSFDLADPIQHLLIYRCVECARWLCKRCIRAHFSESQHDKEAIPTHDPASVPNDRAADALTHV